MLLVRLAQDFNLRVRWWMGTKLWVSDDGQRRLDTEARLAPAAGYGLDLHEDTVDFVRTTTTA